MAPIGPPDFSDLYAAIENMKALAKPVPRARPDFSDLYAAIENVKSFSSDQPRDDHGRWSPGGGSGSGGGGGASVGAGDAAERSDFKRAVLLTVAGAATIAGASAVTALSAGTAPAAVAAVAYIAENFMLAEALNAAIKHIAARAGLDGARIRSIMDGTLGAVGMKAASETYPAWVKDRLDEVINKAADEMQKAIAAAALIQPDRREAAIGSIEDIRGKFLARAARLPSTSIAGAN